MPLPKIPNRPDQPQRRSEPASKQAPPIKRAPPEAQVKLPEVSTPEERVREARSARQEPRKINSDRARVRPVREDRAKTSEQKAPQQVNRVKPPQARKKSSVAPAEDRHEGLSAKEIAEGYVLHEKTGKKYIPIPKSEYDPEGNPVLQLEDFDLDDMNGEAERFLSHLRVAPDKKEQARLREEKLARKRKSDAEYRKLNPVENEDND